MIKLFEPQTGRLRLNWEVTRALGWTGSEAASVDLMTQRLAAHEKAAWMLRSSLGDR